MKQQETELVLHSSSCESKHLFQEGVYK